MKKLFKSLSLGLAALLMAGSLVACGDSGKPLTPEGIYEKVENAEKAKFTLTMELDGMMTTSVTGEKDGNKSHTVTTVEMMGMNETVETYTEKNGDTTVVYTNVGDSWDSSEIEAEYVDDDTSLEAFKELFKSENFGEFNVETGRYEMKKDINVESDGMILTEAYIQISENSFEIHAEISVDESGISMSGSMTIKVELTDVTVTLPNVG
ncbi:MAG: hypothetical protein ACI3YH_00910 [Eubacteriales bacterium]